MDRGKELNEKLRDPPPRPGPSAPALTWTKPLAFSGLRFFPKDRDVVVSAGFC